MTNFHSLSCIQGLCLNLTFLGIWYSLLPRFRLSCHGVKWIMGQGYDQGQGKGKEQGKGYLVRGGNKKSFFIAGAVMREKKLSITNG